MTPKFAVYATGRRLHELVALADSGSELTVYQGSPSPGEQQAAATRYRHLAHPYVEELPLLTNVMDKWVRDQAEAGRSVLLIPPLIVIDVEPGFAAASSILIGMPRPFGRTAIVRGREVVPMATADTLSAGLESREAHALARLAYQLSGADLGADALKADAVHVCSTRHEVRARYRTRSLDFQVTLRNFRTAPLTVWTDEGALFVDGGFTQCNERFLAALVENHLSGETKSDYLRALSFLRSNHVPGKH